MRLIFLDESGFSRNWTAAIEDQPYHVLGAVAVDAEMYPAACEQLRTAIHAVDTLELDHPLGQGFEIKAKEISAGKGWWKRHDAERNRVRDLMLSFPKSVDGTTFLIVIDKQAHLDKYSEPDDPSEIAFQFMFERLQWFLMDADERGLCIYDQTKFMDDQMHADSIEFIRDGSLIQYWSEYYGYVQRTFSIDRIKEFYLGVSTNSVGLQVADYVAHFGYQYFKGGRPSNCGWWSTLSSSLYNKDGEYIRYGLKVFP